MINYKIKKVRKKNVAKMEKGIDFRMLSWELSK